MPIWDFHCELCKLTHELNFKSLEDAENATCPKCGSLLGPPLPSAPNFTIAGYSAKNGYSKSSK